MESHDETGCQAPDRPILCVNNCGFFGRVATMNVCSKCYKDTLLKQDRANLAASSIDSIVNGVGSSSNIVIDPVVASVVDVQAVQVGTSIVSTEPSSDSSSSMKIEVKEKKGPSKCTTCRKRVGLTGSIANVETPYVRAIVILTNMTVLLIIRLLVRMLLRKPILL
ncbi:hypothetical protein C1H46_035550 [Malus baccata]|uniref:A20-type domain-containing protein n=1 Tax=Malus baccata TaxID=106549 RepID=A0A540KY04_MALBA|nr:hypothetical protein C1H46_035550 [Malus baccata]